MQGFSLSCGEPISTLPLNNLSILITWGIYYDTGRWWFVDNAPKSRSQVVKEIAWRP